MANEYQVAQVAVETLNNNPAQINIAAIAVETLNNNPGQVRTAMFAVEVLRSISDGSARRRMPVVC